jgi:hypothetical protein
VRVNGYLVTWDDLALMGATLVNPSNPAPTGNKIVTKSEGLTYYQFQTTPLNSYASNQCPPYEAWVPVGGTPVPTAAPTTAAPTTAAPTAAPTTTAPTTASPTTSSPTTAAPTTAAPTTAPTTAAPTTAAPTTAAPTAAPTVQPALDLSLSVGCDNIGTYKGTVTATFSGGTGTYEIAGGFNGAVSTYIAASSPFIFTSATSPYNATTGLRNSTNPSSDYFLVIVKDSLGTENPKYVYINCDYSPTAAPTTAAPTTAAPTVAPTTAAPTTAAPTAAPTTAAPTTAAPTTAAPTAAPTTAAPTTAAPTTAAPTAAPTTAAPTTAAPTTAAPTTAAPTAAPTTAAPTTAAPTTAAPTTAAPTAAPTTAAPTTAAPTTAAPTTAAPTAAPTTAAPTTAAPTTAAPTTAAPTAAPTTAAPTATPATVYIHLEEYNASPTTFLDANLRVNGSWYYFSGDFSTSIAAGTSDTIQLEAAEATPSNVWGPYTTGSANLLVYENGTLIYNTTNNYYSGSGSQTYSQAITYGAGKTYVISGSTSPIDVPEVCYNCGEGFNLTTGSLLTGTYPSVDICNLDDETQIRVNYNVYARPNRVNIYNNNGFFTSSAWAGEAAYAGPWGSYLNTSPDGNIYFTYSSAYAPYSISVEYGNADPISPIEDDVSIAVFCTPPTGSFDFLRLFPTSSVIPAYATASCNNDPYYNIASIYFTASYSTGPYGYSASFIQDATGSPIWTVSGSGTGIYYEINPSLYTWAWIQNVPTQSVYYPAISDGNNIVHLDPIYECVPLDVTFKVNPLDNTATGQIVYPAYPFIGSQNRGTSYRVTGSLNTLVSVSANATNGSTFRGWSYTSGSIANIFSQDITIQIPLTTTGSIIYALIEKNIVSASFCYYTANPIGTVDCDACAVTKTLYYNGSFLTGSNYASLTWFKDDNLSTTADAGYYKLINLTTSTPIYQVSAGPTQTKTLTGFCNDTTLTC